jgi:cytoskeletal protein RodZ
MKKVSEILKEERESKRLSLDSIEAAIKIKKEFLVAIEEGKFSKLPSEAYAMGFVKNYADYLGVPKDKAGALFRREFEEEKREVVPEFRKKQHQFEQTRILHPKMVFGFLMIVIFAGFIALQYHSLFIGPELKITSPINGQTIEDNIVQIEGETEADADVFIDGEEVFVSLNGTFKKSMYVFPGEKSIIIASKNRFGKETKATRMVMVK